MRMLAILPFLASVILQKAAAQGGAESLAFPGYLPGEYVKAPKPIGDDQPNDIYQHLQVRRPYLSLEEVVIYPHHFGFEYGQDPEHSIYEVHNAKELQAKHNKKHGKKHKKHNKHGKHIEHSEEAHHHHHEEYHHHHENEHHDNEHNHHGDEHHHHNEEHNHHGDEHHHHEDEHHHEEEAHPNIQDGYGAPAPKRDFRPRPAYPSSNSVHPHFG